MNYSKLLEIANKAKSNSYSPYSNFRVGAVLVAKNGSLYTGTNVENSSYGLTNCAERTAVFKAVSEGETNFLAIAIASNLEEIISPCGICRQVLAEFMTADAKIILGDDKQLKIYALKELLPLSFDKSSLENGVNDEV